MLSTELEMGPIQVLPEMLHDFYFGKQFFACDAVVLLWWCQGPLHCLVPATMMHQRPHSWCQWLAEMASLGLNTNTTLAQLSTPLLFW